MRVVEEVGLSGGGDVARAVDRPTHDDHLLDQLADARFEQVGHGDVGQRSDRQQGDFVRMCQYAVHDGLRGAQRTFGHTRFRQGHIPQSVMAVHERRSTQRHPQRIISPAADRNMAFTGGFQQDARVFGGQVDGRIAKDGRNADQFHIRAGKQHGHRKGIINTGIGIQPDFFHECLTGKVSSTVRHIYIIIGLAGIFIKFSFKHYPDIY